MKRYWNGIVAYSIIVLMNTIIQASRSQDMGSPDYSNDPPDPGLLMEKLILKTGAKVELFCGNRNTTAKIRWQFFHCNTEEQCNKVRNWKKLDTMWKHTIENVTVKNAGRYQCRSNHITYKEYILFINMVTTSSVPQYGNYSPPRIVSWSNESIVLSNETLTINCLSRSETIPEVRWFKQCHPEEENTPECLIQKNGYFYRLPRHSSNSSYIAVPVNNSGIYMSKLKIYGPQQYDAGVYVCVVITAYGDDYKNVTVKIADPSTINVDKNHRSFPLLFLIPLAFLLVPIIVWLCYYQRKESTRRAERKQQEIFKPMISHV